MNILKAKSLTIRWITRLFLLLVTAITIYPIFWNIYSSFKTNNEFMKDAFSLPKQMDVSSYARAWDGANIGENFFNSALAVVILLIIIVVCVIPCSYILSRYTFWGSKTILNLFMAAIFIKATYIMIPLFLQMNGLGLINNLPAYAAVYAVTQFPFSIFLMVGYMKGISLTFEEAAKVDGCSNFRILTQIIIPMAKPGIFTVCMLSGMAIWNDYPVALVMLSDPLKTTLPVGLASLNIRAGAYSDFVGLFAALVIVLIPTVFFYGIGQRYLIQGVSAGGLKG